MSSDECDLHYYNFTLKLFETYIFSPFVTRIRDLALSDIRNQSSIVAVTFCQMTQVKPGKGHRFIAGLTDGDKQPITSVPTGN